MYTILNQNNEEVAYIQNRFILDVSQENVIGILIGDCFFGRKQQVIGKIFNKTAYLTNGQIVGKVIQNVAYKNTGLKIAQTLAAWEILSNIKEHTSTWIVETTTWSDKPFLYHLL
jgi:hypothetical protein